MKRILAAALVFGIVCLCLFSAQPPAPAQTPAATTATVNLAEVNLATMATPTCSNPVGEPPLLAIQDGFDPRNSQDRVRGVLIARQLPTGTWVDFSWSRPISTNRIALYWFTDNRTNKPASAYRVKYWDGSQFVPVSNPEGLGSELNQYNVTTFAEVRTDRVRLELEAAPDSTIGLLEWKVFDSGKSPKLMPKVNAGPDRIVVLAGQTYLNAAVRVLAGEQPTTAWSKVSGHGAVTFGDANAGTTTARFSELGEYVLQVTGSLKESNPENPSGILSANDTVTVRVEPVAPPAHLSVVDTKPYAIDSKLWNDRIKAVIVHWIPHCYTQLSNLSLREGGINNFIQAANKLAGRPSEPNVGYPFTDAYVYNTMEAMCLAQLVDAGGDKEILDAQKAIREKLEEWIPLVLAAQEPDGYLQTRFTRDPRNPGHWTIRGDHEGYVSGYFLEAAIANFRLTEGQDRRMYDAAKRLADCWERNLGPPPKKAWYDGHQEMEYALIRLARLVDETDGKGQGDKYVALSKFLLDGRKRGSEYDQSHLPVTEQYEAVGHAVRAVYQYTAMAEIAKLTGDLDYQSAVRSIWDNVINRKYYLTGGVGNGETSEGFGPDFALRNAAYCEACSSCGEIYFQMSLGLTHQDARYADLFEQTLYNAVLGTLDLEGENFRYTNPLDERGGRTAWHVCPCCVGNIPRTLLQLPTWMYAKGPESIYVNLFIGSKVKVEGVAGTNVELVQATEYPWNGDVTITVNPQVAKAFTVFVRSPDRDVSTLYSSTPNSDGITSISVNGSPVSPQVENGYVAITRTWQPGDKIQLALPMAVERVKCLDRVASNRGRVALRRGPLVYNVESVDGDLDRALAPASPLTTEWRADLLNGVQVITGQFADGTPLLAVPNYARNNRGPAQRRSIVWLKEQP